MRYSTTLVLALVVIVAAALLYTYRDKLTGEYKPPEKPAAGHALVADLRAADVTKATLEERGADNKMKVRLDLAKVDGKWRLTAPVAAAADEFKVDDLVRAAAEARFRQALDIGAAKGQADLKALGLDPPAYRLTISADATGGKPARAATIDIGQKAALGEGLFVRIADAKKVNVLENSDLLTRASDKIESYRGRDLVVAQRDELVRIDLDGEKGKVRLDRAEKAAPSLSADEPPLDRWVIAQPLAARADGETVSKIIQACVGARAAEFVDDSPADLGRYGLAKPRLIVTLFKAGPASVAASEKKGESQPTGTAGTASDAKAAEKPAAPEAVKVAALKFGGWTDPKHESVFVQVEGSPSVYSLAAQALTDLNKSAADLRDKHVVALDAARAAEIALRIPAKLADGGTEVAYSLVKVDGAWKVRAAGRPDAKADPAAVDGLLKEIAGLKVLYYPEPGHESLAGGFTPQGSVRIQLEKESAPVGFEFGGAAGEAPSLVKNLREDWIGRINDKGLAWLRKGWLDMLDKQVLSVDAKKVAAVAIDTADRKLEFARSADKAGDKWNLVKPIAAEPQDGFVEMPLEQLRDVRAAKFLAATGDAKSYGLDPGELVVRITLEPGAKAPGDTTSPAASASGSSANAADTKILRLAHGEKGRFVGRVDGSDLVFEAPAALFHALAAEPLPTAMVELGAAAPTALETTFGDSKTRLVKIDEKWFRADAKGNPGEELPADAVGDLVKAAAGLKAERWVAYDAKDPAAFGLDKPAARIKVIAGDTSATILISDKDVPPALAALFDQRPLKFAMTEGGQRIALIMGRPADTLLGAAKSLEPKKEEPKPAAAKPADTKAESAKPTDTSKSE